MWFSNPWNANFWEESVWLLRNEMVGVGALDVEVVFAVTVGDGVVVVLVAS